MIEHTQHCQDYLRSLSDYVDGNLADNLCSDLERHLRECPNCRVVVDTLRKTVELYHTTGQATDIPADVRDRLFVRLDLNDYCR